MAKEAAAISPFDHGFLYGLGLFETFRVYDGHPFLLDDHLERLNNGLSLLNIKTVLNREQLLRDLSLLLEKNGLTNAYVRLNVSAGNGEIGLQTEPYVDPNVIIFVKPLPPAGGLTEKKAVLLELPRNSPEGTERLKSHHFLNNVLAKREVGNALDVEGVFLTKEGYLAEGIVSNLFWTRGSTLFTPSVETGILNGVTRQFITSLARQIGLEVVEGCFRPEELEVADELFLTNSIQEIVAVNFFEKQKYPGIHGKASRLFHDHYRRGRHSLWSRNEMGAEEGNQ